MSSCWFLQFQSNTPGFILVRADRQNTGCPVKFEFQMNNKKKVL